MFINLKKKRLTRMEELSVSTSTDFINNSGFQIDHDSTRNMLTRAGFTEESVKGVITSLVFLGNVTIRLNTVFKTVKFPTGVTNLDTSLTNVNGNNFSHFRLFLYRVCLKLCYSKVKGE
ncbi:uncharacterized protein B0P05DRAFT_53762 [Gilbertella persicaria]|uniref:uncharacterized protein n=1 Tax=Gilbertella persicaria TaxID=101096 RepID=UPI00221E5251|nr:uncharacterized protein B0P05DRAFT_53762 [Gilbertella persicaria]KAI8083403.1 hypothetical protein B0P05DRAFT_53762 [Gilbertella persicaria]